jgi:hypothetical protein
MIPGSQIFDVDRISGTNDIGLRARFILAGNVDIYRHWLEIKIVNMQRETAAAVRLFKRSCNRHVASLQQQGLKLGDVVFGFLQSRLQIGRLNFGLIELGQQLG